MRKADSLNAEPVASQALPRPNRSDSTGPHGRNRINGAPRSLIVLFSALGLGVIVLWGIRTATAQIDFHLLVSALRATPTANLVAALGATALSYLALVGYDVCGLRYARAHAPLRTILLASFCGFAIGNSVGLGAFSGGAVRYRLYTAAGLSPGQIARVILFIAIAFGVGLAVVGALGLILHASEVSRLLDASPEPLRAIAVIILALAAGFLMICAMRRTPLRRGPIEIDAPGTTLVLIQILFAAVDVLAAATTLWVLLPPVGVSFFAFAAIYAAALGLGLLSHIPGGLGVFELAILYAVGSHAPVNAVAAALVTYRAIYFLGPLLLSTVLLAGVELRHSLDTATGRRIGRSRASSRPSSSPPPPSWSARPSSRRARCRPSSTGCRSCTSRFRCGRSRHRISLPASPVSACCSQRADCISGSTARGGWPCRWRWSASRCRSSRALPSSRPASRSSF